MILDPVLALLHNYNILARHTRHNRDTETAVFTTHVPLSSFVAFLLVLARSKVVSEEQCSRCTIIDKYMYMYNIYKYVYVYITHK